MHSGDWLTVKNVDDFDWPQDEIDKLKRMMLSVLTANLSAEEIETLNAL